jgi:hypothetical protein
MASMHATTHEQRGVANANMKTDTSRKVRRFLTPEILFTHLDWRIPPMHESSFSQVRT